MLDDAPEKSELEQLRADWPSSVIEGVLDEFRRPGAAAPTGFADVLKRVWYHETDSTSNAFHAAGSDAARKILANIHGNWPRL